MFSQGPWRPGSGAPSCGAERDQALASLHGASGSGQGSSPTSVAWEHGERAIKLTGSRKEEGGGKPVVESRKARFQFA